MVKLVNIMEQEQEEQEAVVVSKVILHQELQTVVVAVDSPVMVVVLVLLLAELQFVEVRDENEVKSVKLAVKVHSLVFAPPPPKATVVSHSADELESVVRASKKVRRL